MVVRQCVICSKDFSTYQSRIKQGNGIYCSLSCRNKGKLGKKHSKECKRKIGLKSKGNHYALGYKHTPEAIEKIRAAGKRRVGMKFSEEHRKHIGESKKGIFKGKNHPTWTGKNPSYRALHLWLENNFGSADRCENKNCIGRSKYYDWAKLEGKEYERKRKNFIRLCRSCHKLYDTSKITISR